MRSINSLLLFVSCCIFGLMLAVQAHAAPAIEWQPEQLGIHQTPGSTINETITVTFSQDADTLSARLTPSLDTWLSVLPVILEDVQAGQSLQITLSGIIPADEAPATQRGTLQIRSGASQNNLAKPLPIAINVFEGTNDGLPPDPGEAGKQTLMGVDSDGDGLRDDVQRYIYLTYPDQPNVQGALRQLALSLQETLDPSASANREREISDQVDRSIDCVHHFKRQALNRTINLLSAQVLNTLDRTKIYAAYDKKLAGGVFYLSKLPLGERYKLCEFEIVP